MTQDLIDSVAGAWWYYNVELKPGFVTKGGCPADLPMLPRMLTRDADLTGMHCLDIGSMEGLMPAMMRRKGAARVLATDAIDHCTQKMAAVKAAYGVDFEFRRVGLAYEMSRKLKDQGGFDFINFSGVNYHVFSPMHCLAGLRPLLKRNGLMVIGTNCVNRDGHTLEFNDRGRLQRESNTFWYHSIPMTEYLARYFRLVPIDCLYYPHGTGNPATHVPGLDLGYLVMVCRAVDEDQVLDGDDWARRSRAQSWEFQTLCDTAMMNAQPVSPIAYRSPRIPAPPPGGINLMETIRRPQHVVASVSDPRDAHTLLLEHTS
jgi:2-polyprenyl-3-methyl-5-hydroxy-6-metoxy-1,4-benzoquinol methylase